MHVFAFRPIDEGRASKFYGAVLRCLNTAVLEGRSCHMPLLPKLGVLLPRLFCYGISSSGETALAHIPAPGTVESSEASLAPIDSGSNDTQAKAAYVPPHLRNNSLPKGKAAPVLRNTSRRGSTTGWRGSEESGSETDTALDQALSGSYLSDTHRSSRIRTAAINILQVQ